jgi:tetratricopeptide (TPR) repeat protein/tRNA A-37 threonylcarbamoyl transferase component Bud32
MGVVYAAYDPELDRKVAIKLLLDASGGSPKEQQERRTRLMREAQAMAKLSHPNVITVHDVGEFRQQVFVAMEFIEGTTLTRWRKEKKRSWAEVLSVFRAAGRGLAAAHKAGLVHRDFKPDNVLLGLSGDIVSRVIVTDFGLARPAAGRTDAFASVGVIESTPVLSAHLTQTGALVGTPAYMAPEQLAGERSDSLADQFSFCVALFEALYGQRPFAGKVLSELMANVTSGSVRAVPRASAVPRWIRRAVLKGLATDPDDRHPNMEALLAALARDPRRMWRRWGAVVLPSVVLAIGLFAYQRDPDATATYCDDVASQLADRWDDPTRAAVQAAFAATDKPYADAAWSTTSRHLDAWAEHWIELQRAACRADIDGTQPQALLALRMSCLERHLGELGALTEVLVAADAETIERAVDAASALPDPAVCEDVERLASRIHGLASPQARAIRGQLDMSIARAQVLRNTGRYGDALGVAQDALDRATEANDRWIAADALTVLGDVAHVQGDSAEAAKLYHRAMSAALASDNSQVVVRVAIGQLWVGAEAGQSADDAERWFEHGSAALERLGPNAELSAQLHEAIAASLLQQGAFEEAEEHMRTSLTLRTGAFGAGHASLNSTWTNLGRLYASQRRYDDALSAFERARTLTVAEYGHRHPQVAQTLHNLGSVHGQRHEYAEAQGYFEHALAIREVSLGSDHPYNASSRLSLATALRYQGRLEEARRQVEQAVAVLKAQPQESLEQARARQALAGILEEQGELEEAADAQREALAIATRVVGEGDAARVPHQIGTARALSAAGRHEEAIELARALVAEESSRRESMDPALGVALTVLAEVNVAAGRNGPEVEDAAARATSILDAQGGEPTATAAAQFVLARILFEQDAERARMLAESARQAFEAGGPPFHAQRRAVEAWIDAH